MNRHGLTTLKTWFSEYTSSFAMDSPEDQRNLDLKTRHTFEVCKNMKLITEALGLDADTALLAEAVALFHDIGRFRQYAEYKTFLDSVSVNHGCLGGRILQEEGILGSLSPSEQDLLMQAVQFHNAFTIPEAADEDLRFFLRLIRDADKLDIWRVFIEYYEAPEAEKASAAGLGLPDTSEYAPEVISCISVGRVASLRMLKTLNDFKLLQLSWVYDLNFIPSVRLLSQRGYIGKIIATLPQTEEIRKVSGLLETYVRRRMEQET